MAGILDSPTQYSKFNENNNFEIDNFEELADYSYKDISDIKTYQSLKSKETALTTSEQATLLSLVEKLKNKILTVESFNKIYQSVAYMQKYFKDNTVALLQNHKDDMDSKVSAAETQINNSVADAKNTTTKFVSTAEKNIDDKVAEAKSDIDTVIGRLSIKYSYSSETTYEPCNLVTFSDGKTTDLYICNKQCKGISPTSTNASEYWTKLSIKGDKGEAGANFSFSGEWSSTKSYNENELVIFNNGMYVSLQNDNLGNAPNASDSEYWEFWQYQVPDNSIDVNKFNSNVINMINETTIITDTVTSINRKFEISNGEIYLIEV